MSLELKVEVGKAQSSLEQIKTSLTELKAAFNEFKGGSSLERALTRIGQFQGLNPNAVHSVGELGRALDKISASSTSSLSGVSVALKALASINVGTVAQNVSKLSTALAALKVPSSLTSVAQTLSAIGTAASTASGQVSVLASNLNKVKAPNLSNLGGQLNSVGSGAASASKGVYGFGNAMSTVTGLIAGFGISLGGVGIAQFISASWEAGRAVSQFSTQMTGLSGSGQIAQAELDYVKKAALNLGLPLNESLNAYSRLMQAFVGTEAGVEGAKTVFEGFGTALAAMGANSEQSERTFRALTQMVNKGKITAEEFTQQLGDGVIPAMRVMQEATGKSAAEIFKMMEAGQLGTAELIKMAETLKSKYGSTVEASLKTAYGAMRQFTTALTILQAEFGTGFGEGIRSGLANITRAFMEVDSVTGQYTGKLTAFGEAVTGFGSLVGTAFGSVLNVIGLVGQNWEALGPTITSVGAAVATFIGLGLSGWFTSAAAGAVAWLSAMNPYAALFAGLAAGIQFIVSLMGGWNTVFTTAGNILITVGEALGFITPKVAEAGRNWLTSFNQIKSSTDQAAVSVTSFGTSAGGASNSLVSATEKTRQFGAATGEAARESAQLDAAIAATTASTRTFDGLMNEINGTFTRVNGEFDDVVTSGNTFDSLLGSMGGKTNTFDSELQGANTSMATGSKAAEVIAGAYDKTGTSANTSAGKVEVIAGAYEDTATAAGQAYGKVDAISGVYEKTGTAAGNAATGASSAASNISQSATSASNAIAPLNRLAEAYDKAAAAARRLKAAESGTGGGDVGGETGGYSGGGIVGNAPTSQWAPYSAFAGAPKFADGTANTNNYPASLPGGGIPSILHANEAVVPLTGGGSIPVQMVGGGVSAGPSLGAGGGAANGTMIELLTMAQLDYTLQGEMKVELYRIWESIDLFMTVSKEHWSKVDADHLQMINHLGVMRTALLLENSHSASMLDAINKLPTKLDEVKAAVDSMSSAVSSSLSSMASSISSMPSSSSSSTPTSSSNTAPTSSNTTTTATTSASTKSLGGNAFNFRNPGDDTGILRRNGKIIAIQNEDGVWTGKFAQALFATGSPNAWRDVRGVPSYAAGTENTNLDGKGGFMAMLHPNEAVIPLPDGRTVPVSLSGDSMGATSGGDNSVTVNVTMQVDAKDASTFAASKRQLVQELEAELKKTARKLGRMSVEDDPTQRVT